MDPITFSNIKFRFILFYFILFAFYLFKFACFLIYFMPMQLYKVTRGTRFEYSQHEREHRKYSYTREKRERERKKRLQKSVCVWRVRKYVHHNSQQWLRDARHRSRPLAPGERRAQKHHPKRNQARLSPFWCCWYEPFHPLTFFLFSFHDWLSFLHLCINIPISCE